MKIYLEKKLIIKNIIVFQFLIGKVQKVTENIVEEAESKSFNSS